ncbi:putative von Willebrand factor A domain-containing protein 7-like [Scophthalmus maximus]|uniref:Putative von Willebrand factor A domain-containing protein 7-like n=1 Tax=Scophthalmus maximus TaxID=52904 RepID=A0A2U9BPG1_SCOMX|nr:putative von Willebrand factor A domain-containing protein 7-like [Scophthalmus maximus]
MSGSAQCLIGMQNLDGIGQVTPSSSSVMTAGLTVTLLMAVGLSLPGPIHCFLPLFSFDGNSTTHRDITQRAVLRKTAEVCRDIAASEGRDFSLTIDDRLSASEVQRACSSTGTSTSLLSSVLYHTSIANMYFSNAKVDVVFALSEEHHFDDETFQGGRDVITAGKCSHGGLFDLTSKQEPVGGISKDDVGSSHGSLHHTAADLAVNATMELLEDIRAAVGDKNFLRLMGLSQSSALCFVIDTTGSMSDDIAEAKRVSFDIIDSKRGTQDEPSAYILVPFNDPGFGPLLMTTDADIFKANINKLSASGGGDIPELCLSGLQLALTAAPPSSEIFVFTDAPAKDAHLKSTISALIESTKSVVTFMLTDVRASRRRRSNTRGGSSRAMGQSDAQLYRDLARTSGGQAIEVSKSDLSVATAVIQDSTASAVVTVFQVVKNPGSPDNFTFTVDGSLMNMTAYITGASSLTFDLTSSTGLSQSSSQSSGPLASSTTAGNLRRLSLNTDNQTGSWQIRVNSNSPYSVKSLGSGNFLVTFSAVPAGDFVVRLKGEDSSSSSRSTASVFQRQASTQMKTSGISVTAQANDTNVEPGSTISIPFTVATTTNGVVNNSATGTFAVRANNDRSYTSTSPSTLTVAAGSGGTANGTVTLTVPTSAASGTDVTLTIEAENAAASDVNYAILRLSVTAKVTDVTRPVCQEVSTSTDCSSASSLCSSSKWEFIANFTDGVNGTGIESITIRKGNGTLNTSALTGAGGENVTVVTYSASCCSQNVELTAVDKIGNVGTCVGQAREATTAAPVTTAAVNTTSTGGHTLKMSHYLWMTVAVSLLWK